MNSRNAAEFGQPLFACNDSDDNDAFEPENEFSKPPLGVHPLDENTGRDFYEQTFFRNLISAESPRVFFFHNKTTFHAISQQFISFQWYF